MSQLHLVVAFIVLWGAWVVGMWLFLRAQKPPWRKYWYPRLPVIGSAIPVAVFGVPAFFSGGLLASALFGLGVCVATYISLSAGRVCDRCGTIVESLVPDGLPSSCPSCGAQLSAARLSDPPPTC